MRGMTLIEIVVAMSMLGLVAAVVLPSLVVPP
ncbi:MAG: type II secretion system protein, partial [Gemmatimonadetes bacterium]|nr:type II secretion system protein [Gemmatimonadota bacterium]